MIERLRRVNLLGVSVEGLSEHGVFVGVADLGNFLAEAINSSQDLDPGYLIPVTQFAIDEVQGMLLYGLEELQKLDGLLCFHN